MNEDSNELSRFNVNKLKTTISLVFMASIFLNLIIKSKGRFIRSKRMKSVCVPVSKGPVIRRRSGGFATELQSSITGPLIEPLPSNRIVSRKFSRSAEYKTTLSFVYYRQNKLSQLPYPAAKSNIEY